MSFDELFNPGARHLQDELEAERILPVPIPVDRAHMGSLPDLGVSMPGLEAHPHASHPDASPEGRAEDGNGGPAEADPPPPTD